MKRFQLFAACLAAAVLCAGSPRTASADPNTGIVRGYVRSEHSGRALCGVRVYATSSTENTWSTLTDDHGFFVFLALFPGIATLNAQAPRGELERNVQVSANRYSELILYVEERAGRPFSRCGVPQRTGAGRKEKLLTEI